jgi:acyl-CoA synthetase (AMP-forming)/AMP-acid ligase II
MDTMEPFQLVEEEEVKEAPSVEPASEPVPKTKQNLIIPKSWNIAYRLRDSVQRHPYKRAVVYPVGWDENGRVAYTHLTFAQLDEESDALAYGLENQGIRRGAKTILMVTPSLEFFALVFALYKTGAVPVIIDPGMGAQPMAKCLSQTRADAFIGIPKAHLLRWTYPACFKTIRKWVTVGRRILWAGITLNDLHMPSPQPYKILETDRDDTAAILFTTGSTGPAKGVIYTHSIFNAQVNYIQSHFNIGDDEIDLPTFPLFALFDPALGMTAVIPDMDFTRPALADPIKIIEAITDQGVTNMFASPALLRNLAAYGMNDEIRLPSLRRAISAGAPVSTESVSQFSSLLTGDAEVHTPYGATEAMPVMSISSREILKETRKFSEKGYGTCIGKPVGDIVARIIRITDDPIEAWNDDLVVASGVIGEIVVKGSVVTRQYFERKDQDLLTKIQDKESFWHRMGDLGWQDNKGRVWFCGRKNHRVITENGSLFTIPCEAIFNKHPSVFRSALVGIGRPPRQKPIICIELKDKGKGMDQNVLRQELLNLAAKQPMTEEIKTVIFHEKFPVDVRHNSKIFREKLAEWSSE